MAHGPGRRMGIASTLYDLHVPQETNDPDVNSTAAHDKETTKRKDGMSSETKGSICSHGIPSGSFKDPCY